MAVVIASAGRPALLADAVRFSAAQSGCSPDILVSVPDSGSLPAEGVLPGHVRVVMAARGASAQRNEALDLLPDTDVVVFFDDDALIRADYIDQALKFFEAHPDVVGLTGRVLLDGARGAEIPRDVALAALVASEGSPSGTWRLCRELYGCNFAFRMDRARDLRFDSRLPLYSWLEDHDLARRLLRIGRLARVDDCVIVHRGATSGGRQSHLRFGYSQVMNPIYLYRKGSFPLWLSGQQIFRPVAKNIILSLLGPAKSWRRSRLRGNVVAAVDVVRGRVTPERIVDL